LRLTIHVSYPPVLFYQVRSLYGADDWLKWSALLACLVQLAAVYIVRDFSWTQTILLAYTLGGIINHSMTLCMHEISHNLAFAPLASVSRILGHANANRIIGIVANLPLGIPSSVSFRRYHMEHHNYQGEDGIDADIPTAAEGLFVRNSFSKTLWVLLQPVFYALRPVIVFPKKPTLWEGVNLVAQVAFDYLAFTIGGNKGLAYLILGTLLGMGIHPMAGHFIAEHYTFIKSPSAVAPGQAPTSAPQETYSYYGPLNWFSYNVGFHNEHHDFPFIPGSRLPKLREMAPEFYDTIPHHDSWVMVIWNYITDAHVGPFSRVKRKTMTDELLKEFQEESRTGTEKAH